MAQELIEAACGRRPLLVWLGYSGRVDIRSWYSSFAFASNESMRASTCESVPHFVVCPTESVVCMHAHATFSICWGF